MPSCLGFVSTSLPFVFLLLYSVDMLIAGVCLCADSAVYSVTACESSPKYGRFLREEEEQEGVEIIRGACSKRACRVF
jgi:hypothetical protein